MCHGIFWIFLKQKTSLFFQKKKIAIFAATNKLASTLHSLSLLTLSLTLLRQLVLLLCLFALLLLLLLLLLPLLISIALSASWHMMRRRKFCTNCLHQRFCILIALNRCFVVVPQCSGARNVASCKLQVANTTAVTPSHIKWQRWHVVAGCQFAGRN